MASKWNGCTVSVTCVNGLGTYQGLVSGVHHETQTIYLSKPFKNGVPCNDTHVALSAHLIEDIKIIENAAEPTTTSSTVAVSKPVAKRTHRPVSENIAHYNPGPSLNNSPPKQLTKPLPKSESPRKALTDADTFQSALFLNTNKKNPRHKWTERDEACFGETIKPYKMMKEFDFEKNLALFDKKAVFEEISAQQRPDVVRQTDRAAQRAPTQNYARTPNDEATSRFRQIAVPQSGGIEYITDEGMIVPSVSVELRDQLFAAMTEAGFTFARQAELVGRAVTEVAVPLLGGAHRLNPLSTQRPVVVVLAGSHKPGAMSVNAARQLSSQGVDTIVFLSHPMFYDEDMDQELYLYKQTGQKVTDIIHELPTSGVDLVIVALADEHIQRTPRSITSWAGENYSLLLAVDPPTSGTQGLQVHYSVTAGLPLAHAPSNGKLFLANLAVPQKVFSKIGIRYKPPFGPKFVIPLHKKT